MNNVKRDKKKEVVKPDEDHHSSEDYSDHGEQKYDEHCEVKKSEGKTHCRRKCRTICAVECCKDVNYKYEWCYKTKEDKKWKDCESEKIPKKCDNHDDHHDDKK